MNHKKMLCWVRPEQKTELLKLANNQFQIIFTDNYKNFEKKITDKIFTVISLSIIKNDIKGLQTLLKKYPNNRFRILVDLDYICGDVIETFTEADRRYRSYTLEELIEKFNNINSC